METVYNSLLKIPHFITGSKFTFYLCITSKINGVINYSFGYSTIVTKVFIRFLVWFVLGPWSCYIGTFGLGWMANMSGVRSVRKMKRVTKVF